MLHRLNEAIFSVCNEWVGIRYLVRVRAVASTTRYVVRRTAVKMSPVKGKLLPKSERRFRPGRFIRKKRAPSAPIPPLVEDPLVIFKLSPIAIKEDDYGATGIRNADTTLALRQPCPVFPGPLQVLWAQGS